MAVKVVIKRTVNQALHKDLAACVDQMRRAATKQTGYFYGETLSAPDDHPESVVVSTWQSHEHWERWLESTERVCIQKRIDALPGSRTEYEISAY